MSAKKTSSNVETVVVKVNPNEIIKFYLGKRKFVMTRREMDAYLETDEAQQFIRESQSDLKQYNITVEYDDGLTDTAREIKNKLNKANETNP